MHKLFQTLELDRAIISIDAIGTQTDVAEQIIDKRGDCLLSQSLHCSFNASPLPLVRI